VILNTQGEKGISPLLQTLEEVSEQCFIPVAAGGGVQSVDDAKTLIKCGAEKVVVRTAVNQISAIAEALGRQSVVRCVDFVPGEPLQTEAEAGEVILQSIPDDGMMTGYASVSLHSVTPVVMLGGCGNYQHMLDAFNAGADACAASSLWAFTDSNPIRAKKWLKNHGVNVRT
jgi:cyclase